MGGFHEQLILLEELSVTCLLVVDFISFSLAKEYLGLIFLFLLLGGIDPLRQLPLLYQSIVDLLCWHVGQVRLLLADLLDARIPILGYIPIGVQLLEQLELFIVPANHFIELLISVYGVVSDLIIVVRLE